MLLGRGEGLVHGGGLEGLEPVGEDTGVGAPLDALGEQAQVQVQAQEQDQAPPPQAKPFVPFNLDLGGDDSDEDEDMDEVS